MKINIISYERRVRRLHRAQLTYLLLLLISDFCPFYSLEDSISVRSDFGTLRYARSCAFFMVT